MARAPQPWTVEDFLAFDAEEEGRYELVDGIVRMMTGASAAHSAIKGNIALALRNAIRGGPCRVDADALKVVTETAVMVPDVMVTCRSLGPDEDRVNDPTLVVEVLSPTTERHDRVRKWRQYQTIETLRHFVLVEQKERRVEVFTRSSTCWMLAIVEPPADEIALDALSARLSLAAVYENSGR